MTNLWIPNESSRMVRHHVLSQFLQKSNKTSSPLNLFGITTLYQSLLSLGDEDKGRGRREGGGLTFL